MKQKTGAAPFRCMKQVTLLNSMHYCLDGGVHYGYNQRGFVDPDFTGAQYRARGMYLNLRMKFDQHTFNLNDRSGGQLASLSGKPYLGISPARPTLTPNPKIKRNEHS